MSISNKKISRKGATRSKELFEIQEFLAKTRRDRELLSANKYRYLLDTQIAFAECYLENLRENIKRTMERKNKTISN
ncbi:MAG: hypothetical protein ACIPMY_04670 [Rickettsia endosymbiont of Pentastiridius leporinus]